MEDYLNDFKEYLYLYKNNILLIIIFIIILFIYFLHNKNVFNSKNKLTIIITASFIDSHPSIKYIKEVIESLKYLNAEYDLILAHDYNDSVNYKKYIDNLKEYIQDFKNTKIVIRDSHGHLTGNIRNSIPHVKTEYILLVQHDLPFIRDVYIDELIEDMEKYPDIKHLKFARANNHVLKNSTWDNKNNTYGYKTYKNNYEYTSVDSFSDNNHLCKLSYYEDIVLKECPDGVPMEDILNDKIKSKEDQLYYGTYVLGNKDYEEPYLTHLDGAEVWGDNPNRYD
jgi:hypothetical protein